MCQRGALRVAVDLESSGERTRECKWTLENI